MIKEVALRVRKNALHTLLCTVPVLGLCACVDDHSPDLPSGSTMGGLDAAIAADAAEGGSGDRDFDAQLAPVLETGCNLTGRWLMTERMLLNVIGAQQVEVNWFYVEMTQQDSQVVMTTAVNCGGTIAGQPPVPVQLDESDAWPAYMTQRRYDGRKGTSREEAGQCRLSFEKMVLVRGATVATYRDLAVPLPGLDQRATATTAGWEDWDNDQNPGVTTRVSGAIQGLLYLASRTWSEYAGLIARDAAVFTIANDWGQERVTLGHEGGQLVVYQSTRDSDDTQQVVEFARLSPTQATGQDASRCEAVRALAPTLTPHANER